MKKLNDYFWIWGHPTNSLYNHYGITKESDCSPVDGAKYLGAKNVYFVPMYKPFDRAIETERAKDFNGVMWSIEDVRLFPEKLNAVISLSKVYKNIKGIIFDDFFNCENTYNNYLNYSLEMLNEYKEKLHAQGLEMWVVLYTKIFRRELDLDTVKKYVDVFDGVSLWFWDEDEVMESYDDCINVLFDIAPTQKKMLGCYLYDFGGEKSAKATVVLKQLNSAKELIKQNKIDGVILHTNAIITEDYIEAVDACKKWLENETL